MAGNVARLRRNLKLTTLNLSHPTIAAEPARPRPDELLRFLELMEMRSTLREAQSRHREPELF